jgi:DNA excision repair protein ERCC-3
VTRPDNPLIVQSDRTLLLETAAPRFEEARDKLSVFAELLKSPEHIHTYRVSPLSLWNAAALGYSAQQIEADLVGLSKYEVPDNVLAEIRDHMSRYGRLQLMREDDGRMFLISEDLVLLEEVCAHPTVKPYLIGSLLRRAGPLPTGGVGYRVEVRADQRGFVKQVLIKVGHPVEDLAGYAPGEPLEVGLRGATLGGEPFGLRDYQDAAVSAFHAGGSERGGSGVVVLPCGAGKTIVGIGALVRLKTSALIMTTNTTALRQWRDEILDKTDLTEDQVGEYSGVEKVIRPITLTTYQLLTYRKTKQSEFKHFQIFHERNWGLIIYDEVHLLPAPIFRAVANLQSRRRLGLTATLVREDNQEEEVFSLIGPKKYDVPWRVLERRGYIAQAVCTEVRVPFADHALRMEYALAAPKDKFRLASVNDGKLRALGRLLREHEQDQVLVIGQYLEQLDEVAKLFQIPTITGNTPQGQRETLYEQFRTGALKRLVVSKVANFAVDLPDANVAIQISGTFGSRQEEAQRLGRVLRPKKGANQARFYSLVTRDSTEQELARKRQLFLTEQGYRYEIVNDV